MSRPWAFGRVGLFFVPLTSACLLGQEPYVWIDELESCGEGEWWDASTLTDLGSEVGAGVLSGGAIVSEDWNYWGGDVAGYSWNAPEAGVWSFQSGSEVFVAQAGQACHVGEYSNANDSYVNRADLRLDEGSRAFVLTNSLSSDIFRCDADQGLAVTGGVVEWSGLLATGLALEEKGESPVWSSSPCEGDDFGCLLPGVRLSSLGTVEANRDYVLTLTHRCDSDDVFQRESVLEFTTGDDVDGDGYTEEDGDCDDLDPSVHPGADEVRDGKDNDCNGEIDE